ncbi:T9SS ring complex lipoprotein PorK/GldK [Wenyingzhuangia aestuarii]|uniref:type IX secretion system lipoprotein PorK/GldK n=1 Tax=Wenyingzhuangia aestuarii TaxID=1647582 RepID=UPI00143A46C6|nr:gliding motility lipoprotein GldK [Wenyingzhuangia aestuarii]
MKKILFLSMIITTLVSCGGFGDRGELIGSKAETAWFAEKPFGMVLVPGGSFTMGKTEENRWGGFEVPPRSVSVKEFFMDDTEITNSEYKEFVYWVRDSIVRTELANYAESIVGASKEDDKRFSIADYKYIEPKIGSAAEEENYTPYQKYMIKTYGVISQNHKGTLPLNWSVPLMWRADEFPDEEYAEVMDQLYLPSDDAGNVRVFDISLLKYSYLSKHKSNIMNVAKKNVYDEVDINVYPDTAVWAKDFAYSHNDVMVKNYFWHTAYEEYPVVGVSWNQAKAFCNWRTKKKNDYLKAIGSGVQTPDFRLPTEAEWEFAARGGIENGKYPWGGPYVTDRHGYYLANFRPKRNNLAADGFTYTVEALSFQANDYGLYNMAGNVSEWTSTAYNTSASYVTSSLNVDVDDPTNKRKVIRGGSWKDIAYFLEVSTQDYEYADSAKSYIGFRTVQDYLGEARWGGLDY